MGSDYGGRLAASVQRIRTAGLLALLFVDMSPSPWYTVSAASMRLAHQRPAASTVATPLRIDQRREPSLPVPREEIAAAAVHGRLYVIGGFDAAGADTRTVFIFDGRRWSRGPLLAAGVDHAVAAVLDGRLYVAGGFRSGRATDTTLVLSATGRSWQLAGTLQHARGALALVALDHSLYAIGGKDSAGAEIPAAEEYDPRSHSWREVGSLPRPRDHLSGFAYHGWACAAGGRSPNTARADCYDPARRAWRQLPDLPAPTSGAGAAVIGGDVVVGGGEDGAEGRMVAQLARLHGGRWTATTMLVPRHGLQFVPFRGRIWACGGGIEPGLHPSRICTSMG